MGFNHLQSLQISLRIVMTLFTKFYKNNDSPKSQTKIFKNITS